MLWFLVESYQRLGGRSAYHIYGKLLTALLIVLKMEAAHVLEPLVYFYQTVGYPILEWGRPRIWSDEKLRCRQLHGRLFLPRTLSHFNPYPANVENMVSS